MKTLIYEEQHGTDIVHIEVTYEEEEVIAFNEKLKKEVCHVIHYDYKGLHGPLDRRLPKGMEETPAYTISNYKRTFVTDENKSNPKLLVPVYRYEYDMNYLPRLSILIDEVLKGHPKFIEEIMYPTFEKEYIPIRSLIWDREEQYMNLNLLMEENIVDKKLKVLEEIRELLLKVKEGDYEIPILPYYEEAQHLFTIEKTITHQDILKALRNR